MAAQIKVPFDYPFGRSLSMYCRRHRESYCRRCHIPILRGPRLFRSPKGVVWHRPRWGIVDAGQVRLRAWCNGSVGYFRPLTDRDFQTADQLPVEDRLCQACERNATNMGRPETPREQGFVAVFRHAPRQRAS